MLGLFDMKAVILEKINSPLIIGDVSLTDLTFGQVLVKVLVSGICGAQLQEISGYKNNVDYVPHLLGHEGCGIVDVIGPGVTKVKKGDKVVMHWRKGDGIESDFPSYTYNGKTIRSGKVTTFSEYSIVSENRITPVPNDTSNDLCALLGCSLSTALSTINLEANMKFGESLIVVGLGGLGINLIKAAKLAGAYPIIGLDINDDKKEISESIGVDLFINCKKAVIKEEIIKAFGMSGADVIIDTSGNKQIIEDTILLLTDSGRYILVGQPKPGDGIEIKNAVHFFKGDGKSIKATQGGQFSPSKEIPRYIKLHKAGVLNIDGIITHRIKLNEINEAVYLIRSGNAGRIIIDVSK